MLYKSSFFELYTLRATMYSFQQMPTLTSLFSTYASLSTLLMLLRSILHDFIPPPLRNYILNLLHHLFKRRTNRLTLIVEEFHGSGIGRNEVYTSAEIYLCTIITTPVTDRLKVSKSSKDKSLTIRFEKGEEIHDTFDSIPLRWRFVSQEVEKRRSASRGGDEDDGYSSLFQETRLFELSFEKQYKDKVINNYIPHVISSAKALKAKERILKLCTLGSKFSYSNVYWDSTNLEHPSTFDTLAIDPEVKESIKEDLDRFVNRREFYRRVGRAWKRGYLLYGPPGTGKSSLIAAMANYLMFDIYDLQLGNLIKDSDLRRLLLATANRSILVIEDIDCTIDIKNRSKKTSCTENGQKGSENQSQLTLSGLLNFIDGLWSCCGDERIIIFTTNNKDNIDPALLRPGRMDMHIHMSYLTFSSFKILASNYLNIRTQHPLFDEIKTLIEAVNVTPAQVAEELMRSEDVGVALEGVVKLLMTQKEKMDHKRIDESESGVSQNVVNLNLVEKIC